MHSTHGNVHTCKVGHDLPKEPVQVFHILHIPGEGVFDDLFSFYLHLLESPAPETIDWVGIAVFAPETGSERGKAPLLTCRNPAAF